MVADLEQEPRCDMVGVSRQGQRAEPRAAVQAGTGEIERREQPGELPGKLGVLSRLGGAPRLTGCSRQGIWIWRRIAGRGKPAALASEHQGEPLGICGRRLFPVGGKQGVSDRDGRQLHEGAPLH